LAIQTPETDVPLASEDASSPGYAFFSRELSWIDFNWRVLNEVSNQRHPLLERVKFLAITDSNLDEFLMVRVSGLLGEVEAGVATRTPDGRTPAQELAEVREAIRPMLAEQHRLLKETLLPRLGDCGICIVPYSELSRTEKQTLRSYFEREIFPVCTPLAIDPAQAFPFISNLSLNLMVVLRDPDGIRHVARIKVPPNFPRLVPVRTRTQTKQARFVWIEELIREHLELLFPELVIEQAFPFRVLRDADFEVREIEAGDLLEKVRAGLQKRRFGEAVALQVDERMSDELSDLLLANLELSPQDLYRLPGPLALSDLMQLQELDRPDLKDVPFVPHVPAILASGQIFSAIQQGDIILHHPYDSFDPVVDFLSQAAADPDVLAIKQTLYRVGLNSPVVEALRRAVDCGKQVAVLLELKARFDEENNIGWAEELERAGVHVMYGFAGLKTHCKVALVVRREAGGIRRYVHIGTGNYNRSTARLYTDLGLLTCREELGADASDLFNFLTGYSRFTSYRRLLVAPINMRDEVLKRIERETQRQRTHGDGRLIFKMNSLTDPQIIQSLYDASQVGVNVQLMVRGICCLRPGVPGLSENVRVVSLVGRFLEHSRVFCFGNGGDEEIFIGSADFMQRNLDYRVEALVPILSGPVKSQLKALLEGYFRDNEQSYELQPNGEYRHRDSGDAPWNMQRALLEEAQVASAEARFRPITDRQALLP